MQKSCCRLTIKSESIYTLVASENEGDELFSVLFVFISFICLFICWLGR